jgi:CHAT domain-containing protein
VQNLAEGSAKLWSDYPNETRSLYGSLLSDGVYERMISLLVMYDRGSLARTVANDWAMTKRNESWPNGPTDARWQTRAWRNDRIAWAIDAALAAEQVQRSGQSANLADQETVLNAVESANRGAAGADFAMSLRVRQQPQDVQQAYLAWRQAERLGESSRYRAVAKARERLGLVSALADVSFSQANGRSVAALREDEAWNAYQTTLASHNLNRDETPLTLSQVAHALRPGEMLLTGVTLADRLTLVSITPDGRMKTVTTGAQAEALEALVARYRSGLSFTNGTPNAFDMEASEGLWRQLGEPMRAEIAASTRIVWAPIRDLDDFPIAALRAPGLGETGWLGIDREIMVTPSLTAFVAMRAQEAEAYQGELLAVGDIRYDAASRTGNQFNINKFLPSTPFAGAALDDVSNGVGGATVLRGPAATKSRLEALRGGSFDVTLFYTHGVQEDLTDRCGLGAPQALVLFQGGQDNCSGALFTPEDVVGLNLRSRMVFLAACATGARPVEDLGPLDGLTRAFLLAGARSVVGARMPVNDFAASRLSPILIKSVMARQESPSKALQSAMRVLEADSKLSHPAYWAQFEVVGEGA